MTADEVVRLSAADIAARIAAGELSAVEVAQAHLDRIAAVDERVHAFLHVDTEGALADRIGVAGGLEGAGRSDMAALARSVAE